MTGCATLEAPSGVTPGTAKHRIGQGAFRTLAADAHRRRCAITGERTVPVLQAARIKSFSSDGPNAVDNGILLRPDMHARTAERPSREYLDAISLGAMSRENCYAICDPYARQSAQAQQQLKTWHGDVASKLEIDLPNARRRRQGLKRAAWAVPGLFNDDLNYSEIPEQTKKEIDRHICATMPESNKSSSRDITDYYNQDIRIIKSGGKTYYLPATS